MRWIALGSLVLVGCASVTEHAAGNGLAGELDLAPAPAACTVGDGQAEVSCHAHQCWTLGLIPGSHRLQIRQRVRIDDCGGFGDCTRRLDLRPVAEQSDVTFTVTPAEAATATLVASCDGDLTLDLTVHQAGEFELAAAAGAQSERWALGAVAVCGDGPFDCSSFDPMPACCCHPETTTTACL